MVRSGKSGEGLRKSGPLARERGDFGTFGPPSHFIDLETEVQARLISYQKGHCSQTCGSSPDSASIQRFCSTGKSGGGVFTCASTLDDHVHNSDPNFNTANGKVERDSLGLDRPGDTCRHWGGGSWTAGPPGSCGSSGSWPWCGIESRQFVRGLEGRRIEFFWFCSLGSSPLSRSLDHISEGFLGWTFGETCPSPTALLCTQ